MSLRGALAVARRSRSKLEHEIPRFTRNKLRNLWARLLVPFGAKSTIGNEIAMPEPALSGKILRYAQNDSKKG